MFDRAASLEKLTFNNVVRSFLNYRPHAHRKNDKKREDLNKLSKEHQKLLAKTHLRKIDSVSLLINKNSEFFYELVSGHMESIKNKIPEVVKP